FHESFAYIYFPSFPTRRSSDLIFLHVVQLIYWRLSQQIVPYFSLIKPMFQNHVPLQQKPFQAEPITRLAANPNKQQLLDLKLVQDRKSTRLNSSHVSISYAVFC